MENVTANTSVASALSPSSGPLEFADEMRKAIDALASRNGKRDWQPAEARRLEKELHALAAAAGAAAEEMEKEALEISNTHRTTADVVLAGACEPEDTPATAPTPDSGTPAALESHDVLSAIGLQVSEKATLAALSGTNKTAHDANAQALAAAHAQHLQELAAAARSLDHICEYWACQQGTGHHQTGQTCPSCGSTNTWEYDGTRTSYDYCKQCKHEWNRWYD